MAQSALWSVVHLALPTFVLLSSVPAVSACNISDFPCGFSRPAVIAIIAGGAVVIALLALCIVCARRRRHRIKAMRIPQDNFGGGGRASARPQESYRRLQSDRPRGNYAAAPPAPVHRQSTHPHQPSSGRRDSRRQPMSPSSLFPVPEPAVQAPPPRTRPPPVSVRQSISPFNSPTPSPSSPVRRVEPFMTSPTAPFRPQSASPPPPTSPPGLPRVQTGPVSVIPSPRLPSPSTLEPPSIVITPSTSPPPHTIIHSSDAYPPHRESARAHALNSIDTGTLNDNDEPPPAYTPI